MLNMNEEVEKNVNENKTAVKEVDLTYDFIGSFDTKRADDFLDWCLSVEEFNDLYLEQNNCTVEELPPVLINLSSDGGEVQALFKCLSALDIIENPVIVRAFGMCASCGLFFYLFAGDVRMATKHSEFLYHNISYGVQQSNLETHRQFLKDSDKLQKKIDTMITERCKITLQQLRKHRNDDWIIEVQEAIELGIVNYEGKLRDLYKDEEEEGAE